MDKRINNIDREIERLLQRKEEIKKENIPKPPKYLPTFEDDTRNTNKRNNEEIKYKVKKKGFKLYVLGFSFLIVSVLLLVLSFTSINSIFWRIIILFVAFPISLLSGLIILIKLYIDRRKITGAIIKTVSIEKNFILATFIKKNKRQITIVAPINNEGTHLDVFGGIYLLDEECVYPNEDNYGCSYYEFGNPNPIRIHGLNNNVDDAFSSKTLKTFKQNKIIEDLGKDPAQDKILFAVLGLCALLVIAIIIIVVVL